METLVLLPTFSKSKTLEVVLTQGSEGEDMSTSGVDGVKVRFLLEDIGYGEKSRHCTGSTLSSVPTVGLRPG